MLPKTLRLQKLPIKPHEDSESTAGGVKNKAFLPFPTDYRLSATRKGRYMQRKVSRVYIELSPAV